MAPISRNPLTTLINWVTEWIEIIEQVSTTAGMTVSRLDVQDGRQGLGAGSAEKPMLAKKPQVRPEAPPALSRAYHRNVQRVKPSMGTLQTIASSLRSETVTPEKLIQEISTGMKPTPFAQSSCVQKSSAHTSPITAEVGRSWSDASHQTSQEIDQALDAIFPQESRESHVSLNQGKLLDEVYIPDLNQIAAMTQTQHANVTSTSEALGFPRILEPAAGLSESGLTYSEPQVLQMLLPLTESPPQVFKSHVKQGFSTSVTPPREVRSSKPPSNVCLSEVLGQGQDDTTDWILLHNSRRAMESLNRLVNDFEFMDD